MREFELVVLGGGNAIGLAVEAGKAGLKTALIERGPLGGTCPNRGCVPSKKLIAFARRARAIRDAADFHIDARIASVHGDRIFREVLSSAAGTDERLRAKLPEDVTLFRGVGTFVGERTLEVDGARLRGRRVVIATGSRPRLPEWPGLEGLPVWTSDAVFRLDAPPASLVVIGGGYVGCEMAGFFRGIGVETTLVQRSGSLLTREDGEVREVFRKGFGGRVPVRIETEVAGVSFEDGVFRVALRSRNGDATMARAAAVLFAVGRIPNSDGIGLDRAGVEVDERGCVRADAFLRTSAEGVYALGDVIGRYPYTHAASYEAEYLRRHLLEGAEGPLDYGPVPRAVFADPEVAGVGATEEELRREGAEYLSASVPYTDVAMGAALKEEHGLCKLLVAPSGRILGCHIVGREAATLIHQVLAVMRLGGDVRALADMMHIHPSLSEVVRAAARRAVGLL